MSKLLIYIGENEFFDAERTMSVISSLDGVSDVRCGQLIGSIFECQYSYRGRTTIVRLSESLETVTAEGLGIDSLDFAVKLQKKIPIQLHAIDIDYSFDVALSDFGSGDELLNAIAN